MNDRRKGELNDGSRIEEGEVYPKDDRAAMDRAARAFFGVKWEQVGPGFKVAYHAGWCTALRYARGETVQELWLCPICGDAWTVHGEDAHCAGSQTEGSAHEIVACVRVAGSISDLGMG